MRVLSILNFKGGTGKTSLAENLSYALTLAGKRVLVIDADRQGNASSTLLGKQVTPTLTQVIQEHATLQQAIYAARPGLDVVPSDGDLDKASGHLNITPGAVDVLKEAISELTAYDFILIDQAGAYTPVMLAALRASSEMLVPCELEPYATSGLLNMFDKLKKELRKHTIANAGIIPYNVDLRYSMSRLYLAQLRETFGDLITSPIRTDSMVPRAQSLHQTVFEYDDRSKAAEDFRTLAADLIESGEA